MPESDEQLCFLPLLRLPLVPSWDKTSLLPQHGSWQEPSPMQCPQHCGDTEWCKPLISLSQLPVSSEHDVVRVLLLERCDSVLAELMPMCVGLPAGLSSHSYMSLFCSLIPWSHCPCIMFPFKLSALHSCCFCKHSSWSSFSSQRPLPQVSSCIRHLCANCHLGWPSAGLRHLTMTWTGHHLLPPPAATVSHWCGTTSPHPASVKGKYTHVYAYT